MAHSTDQIKETGQRLTALQRKLYLYILALVRNPSDAEDIQQETNRVIWEKIEEFKPGTDFEAWAFKIAHFKVLSFRRSQQRERLRFSDEVVEQLAIDAGRAVRDADPRKQALRSCLNKLSTSDREMVSSRYLHGSDTRQVARRYGRSAKSIYQSLSRIRSRLMACIQRTLSSEGRG